MDHDEAKEGWSSTVPLTLNALQDTQRMFFDVQRYPGDVGDEAHFVQASSDPTNGTGGPKLLRIQGLTTRALVHATTAASKHLVALQGRQDDAIKQLQALDAGQGVGGAAGAAPVSAAAPRQTPLVGELHDLRVQSQPVGAPLLPREAPRASAWQGAGPSRHAEKGDVLKYGKGDLKSLPLSVEERTAQLRDRAIPRRTRRRHGLRCGVRVYARRIDDE